MNYNFSRRLMAVAGLVKSGHLILEDKPKKILLRRSIGIVFHIQT